MSLPALLQLCEGEAITGTLVLGEAGHVDLLDGRIVGAACEGHGGRTALLELFLVDYEEFHLDQGPVPAGAPVAEGIEAIMEGCRLADEWARLAGRAVVQHDGSATGELALLVEAAGGGLSLDQARAARGLARCRCVDPLLTLVEQGRVRLGEPVRQLDYYDALEQGRDHLRHRDFDAAEAAFRLALAARPDDRVAQQNLARLRQLREPGGAGARPFPSPAARSRS